MNELDFDELKKIGIDTDDALVRFSNNRALLEKYLRGLPNEPMFEKWRQAITANDLEEIKATTHALKGSCGNLSINSLFEGFSQMMTLLRADQIDEALSMAPDLEKKFLRITEYLK